MSPVGASLAPRPADPAAALDRLLAGNERFVKGDVRTPVASGAQRVRIAQEQRPYVALLTCADSRVAPDLVFDEGLGDIFTVRIAGNTAVDSLVVASLEFAVFVLESMLVFVLGHSQCGAVKGAIDVATKGTILPGTIGDLTIPILPAVESVKTVPEDQLLELATRANIRLAVAQLSAVPIIEDAISAGKLKVAGGEYELESGRVELIA